MAMYTAGASRGAAFRAVKHAGANADQQLSLARNRTRCRAAPRNTHLDAHSVEGVMDRRAALASMALVASLAASGRAQAVQGYIPGRIPGVSPTPDAEGYFTYSRPEAKQGGHGVGWSEIPKYSFRIPAGWEETAVSIADLGGTEIDLRFTNKDEGDLFVVVAPVLRFVDVGFNADIHIDQLGDPDKIINGFAPELFGAPLNEDQVLETEIVDKEGLIYYQWHLKPHLLVSATAVRNRLFICAVEANGRQWRKHQDKLRTIQRSFSVQPEKVVKVYDVKSGAI